MNNVSEFLSGSTYCYVNHCQLLTLWLKHALSGSLLGAGIVTSISLMEPTAMEGLVGNILAYQL